MKENIKTIKTASSPTAKEASKHSKKVEKGISDALEARGHTGPEAAKMVERVKKGGIDELKSVVTEKDYKKLYLDVLSIIDFGAKEDEIPEENIKVIEKIVYRDFNDNLRQCEKDILKDLKMLNDTDILDLHKTRLRPFISMLKSKRVQQVKEVKGATRRHSIQMY